MGSKTKFVYPDRKIIQKTRAFSKLYTHPIIGIVYWNRIKTVYNYLKGKKYGLILEIGCGYGFALPSLCTLADKVIGSDVDPNFTKSKGYTLLDIQKSNPNLELKAIDVYTLSSVVKPNSCDIIVAFDVLEALPSNIDKALNEIHVCLKPGGLFICTIPSANWLYKLGKKLLRIKDTYQNYNYHTTRNMLQQYFREVEIFCSPFGLPLYKTGSYIKDE